HLIELRKEVQVLCFEYNQTRPSNLKRKIELLEQILIEVPENIDMVAAIWVDYGKHVKLVKYVFVNRNFYFMDGNYIIIVDIMFLLDKIVGFIQIRIRKIFNHVMKG